MLDLYKRNKIINLFINIILAIALFIIFSDLIKFIFYLGQQLGNYLSCI